MIQGFGLMILIMGFEPVEDLPPECGMVGTFYSAGCQFPEESTAGRDA
jgi:hypothetical protein